jgi:steroid 5-alpha reductase family enzyme
VEAAGILTRAAAGWVVAALAMTALWVWQRQNRNAGIADAASPLLVGLLAVLYATTGEGAWTRRSAIGWMMGSWGARLGVYMLWARVFGHPENARYQTMRAGWADRADVEFFWMFQRRALAVGFFALPALVASMNSDPALSPLELCAAALWVAGFGGETTADRQLLRFRNNAHNAQRTCQTGLWRYSRHPNYFFEVVMWAAYGMFAAASPWGWIALACPAAMLYLLWNITGIPLTEAQALRSRGATYREYQRVTSVLVPWFPRR